MANSTSKTRTRATARPASAPQAKRTGTMARGVVRTDAAAVTKSAAADVAEKTMRRVAPVSGVRRKKAPEQVRAQLLQAASDIATELGVQSVTLDAVAERAGVTKGALQYHFANKQGLLDALFEQTMERFEQQMLERIARDAGDSQGAVARAYLHTTMDDASPAASTDVLRVLVAAMMTDPDIRERHAAPMRKWTRPDPLSLRRAARTMICRLAADGLWISELLGYQAIPDALRREIVRQLEAMTRHED
jgi:AcrR family transcriptional regulator